jgi:RNA polymerase sigma factor (sigma-70 family)
MHGFAACRAGLTWMILVAGWNRSAMLCVNGMETHGGHAVGGVVQDPDAFVAFYGRNHRRIQAAVAATLSDDQLAGEAVDEAFVRAAERWSEVQAMAQPGGWVYRVAVNWATSWRRKWLVRRPTVPAEQLDRGQTDVMPDLDLLEQLRRLPLKQRQVLILRHGFGLSVAETAVLLGVAQGTVKSASHRASQQIRASLEAADGR